jgi:hypothetical protein
MKRIWYPCKLKLKVVFELHETLNFKADKFKKGIWMLKEITL